MKLSLANAALLTLLSSGCVTDYAMHAPKEYVEVEVIVEVPVEEGWDGEVWVDHFYQSSVMDGIDILWLIDTSGSMHVHNSRVLLGIESMINVLNTLPLSTQWRLAIMSADATKTVNENQFPLTYGSDVVDATNMFNSMGKGGYEEGFDASYEYIMNNSYANTWMRNDAALLIVFVSDEQEQSSGFADGQEYVDWLMMLGRPEVYVASIVNLLPADSICNGGTTNVGTDYIEAANLLGGIIVDICSEDWSPGMTDAANQLEPILEMELTHIPIEESIKVFVDGQVYDNSLWYYEASINSVIFTERDSAGELIGPPPSSLVEVGYVYEELESTDTGDTGDTGS